MDIFRANFLVCISQTECPTGRKIFAGKSENNWTWGCMGVAVLLNFGLYAVSGVQKEEGFKFCLKGDLRALDRSDSFCKMTVV
jgi:hypothetical protein